MGAAAVVKGDVIDFIQPDKAKAIGGDLAKTTQSLVLRLAVSAITDESACQQAVLDRQAIGDAVKRVQEFFGPFKSMAHKLHRALCDRENEILGPVLLLDAKIRSAIGEYKVLEDRRREARERELAEQRRREEETLAATQAAALEAAGEPEMAAAVMEEAIAAPAPIVVLPDTMKLVDGLKFRREYHWRFASTEARALELMPREFLCVDTKKLNAYAKAMKGAARVPGITFYHDDVPVR